VRFVPLAILAALAAPPSGTSATPLVPQPTATSASVSLSSARAGAKPVTLGIVLAYPMQCGYPGTQPIAITFPAQQLLPARIPPTAVLVGGHAPRSVRVSGRVVDIGFGLVPPPRVMCDVIAIGKLELVFTRAAGLGNPQRAGSYRLAVTRGPMAFAAAYAVRRA